MNEVVDDYLADSLLLPDPILDAALAASRAAGLPPIEVSPLQGRFLQLLAAGCGATRILEIGTLGGYSAICLARALPPDGRLVTIEAEPAHAAVARANLARAGLAHLVEVIVAPALDALPRVAGPFDFVFVDADKTNGAEYFSWAVRLGRPGTLVVVDNVVRRGAVADPTNDDANVRGTRRLIAAVAAERRATATVVQTVGAKGHDGFLLARLT